MIVFTHEHPITTTLCHYVPLSTTLIIFYMKNTKITSLYFAIRALYMELIFG